MSESLIKMLMVEAELKYIGVVDGEPSVIRRIPTKGGHWCSVSSLGSTKPRQRMPQSQAYLKVQQSLPLWGRVVGHQLQQAWQIVDQTTRNVTINMMYTSHAWVCVFYLVTPMKMLNTNMINSIARLVQFC